jgi:hypothetical protein
VNQREEEETERERERERELEERREAELEAGAIGTARMRDGGGGGGAPKMRTSGKLGFPIPREKPLCCHGDLHSLSLHLALLCAFTFPHYLS